MVHRLLKRYAKGGSPADVEDLAARCEHCSEQERNAEEAERESVKLKQVEYVKNHVGEEFDGVVSGVTKFGASSRSPTCSWKDSFTSAKWTTTTCTTSRRTRFGAKTTAPPTGPAIRSVWRWRAPALRTARSTSCS